MGGGGEGEVEVWGPAQGFEEGRDSWEGLRSGEVDGLEGGLFGCEEWARYRELGPSVKYFGSLFSRG